MAACRLRVIILFLALHLASGLVIHVEKNISNAFDPREEWGSCSAFVAEDQGSCNACAAAALASAVGLRLCIKNGINLRVSSQRIWDCYRGDCADGVDMSDFIASMISSTLLLHTINQSEVLRPANSTACDVSAVPSSNSSYIITSVSEHREYSMQRGLSGLEFSMQSEIIEKGPIVAILYLTSAELTALAQWKRKGENDIFNFKPPLGMQDVRNNKHAVTVLGWGIHAETQTLYWKILNSFGMEWGKNGIGNIPAGFGLIGFEWYSVFASSLSCAKQSEGCTSPVQQIQKIWPDKASTSSDTMFSNPGNDVWISLSATKKNQKQTGINDGIVLIIVICCMGAISAIICSIHSGKKENGTCLWI